ncbi:response regulator [Idiomarina seosinensis]|uniref:Two-component system response regulator n=1 Tax=Idiomarina seosinensis TaxID=281739 RepID=A0A432ZJ44_9GAMM|nr:response regulator [Idiomarina seosinensis]RUO78055.1 two-component system response regulator [Idiomarina seosinensis]
MSVSLLVVEDKDKTLQQVLNLLEPLQFKVTTATDGLDGLSKAKDSFFDMVLVDHKMPVMDGISLIKSLRDLVDYQEQPIFFMTTQELTEIEPRALKAGATACFSKPLNANVVETLRSYMARSVA